MGDVPDFLRVEQMMQKGDLISYRYQTGNSKPIPYDGKPFNIRVNATRSQWYAPCGAVEMLVSINVFNLEKGCQVVPNLIVERPTPSGLVQVWPEVAEHDAD